MNQIMRLRRRATDDYGIKDETTATATRRRS